MDDVHISTMPADNPPTTPFENETPLPSWETLDFGAGLQELTILRAVEEYLSYHGFNATLKTLRGEVAAGSGGEFNSPDLHAQPSVEKMLSAFDEGRDNLFFRMWGRLEGQAKIANVGSLELRLRVGRGGSFQFVAMRVGALFHRYYFVERMLS